MKWYDALRMALFSDSDEKKIEKKFFSKQMAKELDQLIDVTIADMKSLGRGIVINARCELNLGEKIETNEQAEKIFAQIREPVLDLFSIHSVEKDPIFHVFAGSVDDYMKLHMNRHLYASGIDADKAIEEGEDYKLIVPIAKSIWSTLTDKTAGFAGKFYTDGNVIVRPDSKVPFTNTLVHEYVHYLRNEYSVDKYVTIIDEGFADFVALLVTRDLEPEEHAFYADRMRLNKLKSCHATICDELGLVKRKDAQLEPLTDLQLRNAIGYAAVATAYNEEGKHILTNIMFDNYELLF